MSRRSTSAPRNEARGTEAQANAAQATAAQVTAAQGTAEQASTAQASTAQASTAQANGARPAGPRSGGSRSAASRANGSRASGSRASGARGGHHGIPEATVARLPIYLRALYALADRDIATVSSEELAAAAGVNSAKLRKDLSHLGSYGTRGVGYDVEYLVYQVSRELGLTQDWPVVIVGAGNLGRALANYGGFASRGFRIAALLDCDPAVVGTTIARHQVRSAADIEDVVATHAVSIGVIATPAAAAQDVCDRLLAAGVTSILNFAPVVLNVPSGVDVRKVDLSIELQILAFHAQRRAIVGMTQEREWQERRARRGGERGDREPDASTALALGGESGVEAQAVGT
jgi:redox-sensing transcriptional repressor